ncbi:hypothetical protein A2V71_04700 [Candidatus Berkelbacteria bacterium RBG_13_40_8]|uniref:MGS-like domain-containing protein n=1 Tax=Candidatus Berkelbacteria bacterium RBG_13_40_8 TaxID=1797467 RepID=A0A1F5DMN5_9BACT|nr:MAG: hypothetical protein A2V71_04700 [Candidatus Berkelbacteria bacterium RBG_13_40_8]
MPNALLSVYDKEGIVEFGNGLLDLGFTLYASGGTARVLVEAGLTVHDVSELVKGEAILGHRVVTLSREVHAGLLATDEQLDELTNRLGLPRLDLVCVDLYPLKKEIAKEGSTRESVTEMTDIGGPTMLRSGAKGRRVVIARAKDRQKVMQWLRDNQPDKVEFLEILAGDAEGVVADYCVTSARFISDGRWDGFVGERVVECKAENGQQGTAGLFSFLDCEDPLALGSFQLIDGAPLSYNNWCDIDRMLQTMTHIAGVWPWHYGTVPFIAIGVKHGNPCGASVGKAEGAIIAMVAGDTRAIFGGLVMTNFPMTLDLAETLLTYLMPEGQRRLLDGIVAPGFEEGAIALLRRKGDKCRFVVNLALEKLDSTSLDVAPRFRCVRGGFLRQPNYTHLLEMNLAKKYLRVTDTQKKDLLLAWAICSTSNSNTITLVKNSMLIGNGVGQQDRVGAAKLAISRAIDAGHSTEGAVACSDSFFPFPDAPKVLLDAGIKAILATSGSVNDKLTIEACRQTGVPIYLIPDADGRGFFGH